MRDRFGDDLDFSVWSQVSEAELSALWEAIDVLVTNLAALAEPTPTHLEDPQ